LVSSTAADIDPPLAQSKRHSALVYGDMILIPALGRAHQVQSSNALLASALEI
jgi:hypothetical protein